MSSLYQSLFCFEAVHTVKIRMRKIIDRNGIKLFRKIFRTLFTEPAAALS